MDIVKKSAMAELFGEHSKALDYLSDLQFSFSNLIFSERLKREKNQTDFAKDLGVSQGMLSRWESGDGNFTLKLIAEVADKLRMKPSLTFAPTNALSSIEETKVEVLPSETKKRTTEFERAEDPVVFVMVNCSTDFNGDDCKMFWRAG